jgi:cytochrome b561
VHYSVHLRSIHGCCIENSMALVMVPKVQPTILFSSYNVHMNCGMLVVTSLQWRGCIRLYMVIFPSNA